ncbi:MAG: hypothetical protein ACTSRC_14540 [Candidatus Helarchaeota archaeon]
MSSTEERIAALERMEKKVKRRLLQGHTEEVIPDIRFIITQYRELRLIDKADTLELVLNQFIAESLSPSQTTEQGPSEEYRTVKSYSRKSKREALSFLHRE